MAANNTTATYPDLEVKFERPDSDEVIRLLLDNMEQEREMLIGRLNHLERTLLAHGRTSTKHVKVRAR